MKKSIISVILIALIFVFCGAECDSNKAAYDANNRLNIVHICDMGGNCVDYKVQTWFENQGSGIGFTTEDGNYIWASEGTFIMASNYCPICGRQ